MQTRTYDYRGILEPAYEVDHLLKFAAGEQATDWDEMKAIQHIKSLIEWDGGVYGEPIYVRFPSSLKTTFERSEMFSEIIAL